MDLSVQPPISSSSTKSGNSSIVLSEREKFLSTYLPHQPWSLPDSIIYYISKNPSNSKVYQKMIQSCKYFFIKNPLLLVKNLNVEYKNNQWDTYLNGKNVDLDRASSKLWITSEFHIDNYNPIPTNSLTTVLTKIYQSDLKVLFLQYQKIYITALKFLASKCERVNLHVITVINEDDSVVGLEKIIEAFPKIEVFAHIFSQKLGHASQNAIRSTTVQKLIQVPHFSNIKFFYLSDIPQTFDIDTFYDSIIKKNKRTRFHLDFGSQVSQEYQARLQTIVNEIITTQNHDYKVPSIDFSGIDLSSSQTLYKLL